MTWQYYGIDQFPRNIFVLAAEGLKMVGMVLACIYDRWGFPVMFGFKRKIMSKQQLEYRHIFLPITLFVYSITK